MTKMRLDNHSTEFGLWLRDQPLIDSSLGYVATNLDYIWNNYKTGEWMLIEEKRFTGECSYAQKKLLMLVHNACKTDPKYRGIHLLQFEHTSPKDGDIFWDKKLISKEKLIDILQFKTEATNE